MSMEEGNALSKLCMENYPEGEVKYNAKYIFPAVLTEMRETRNWCKEETIGWRIFVISWLTLSLLYYNLVKHASY